MYARRVFPCLDEPDSKVPWQLTLDVPKGLVAVSNTEATSDTALDGGGHRVVFAETKPLPAYLIAFGVGPFDIVPAGKTKSGVPVRDDRAEEPRPRCRVRGEDDRADRRPARGLVRHPVPVRASSTCS